MDILAAKTSEELADKVAKLTVETLKSAIKEFDEASWVLSGGTTPERSYDVIASKYRDYLDWQKVWFLMGDERQVIASSPDSNWGNAEQALLSKLDIKPEHKIAPAYNPDLRLMAGNYEEALGKLPKADNGLPRLDLIWLGIGEDGHTLSLFPDHNLQTEKLVAAVTDAPKSPRERISLTLLALKQAKNGIILASGVSKAEAVAKLLNQDLSAPIALAVKTIENSNGKVCLVTDLAPSQHLG